MKTVKILHMSRCTRIQKYAKGDDHITGKGEQGRKNDTKQRQSSSEKRYKSNRIFGRAGESRAVEYLDRKGYEVIAQNYRCRFGEIDIIAACQDVLCFIEVKTRRSNEFGTPAEAVTYYKKRNFVNTAKWYLMEHPTDMNIRFDIIEVYGVFDGNIFELENINHFEQVFSEI